MSLKNLKNVTYFRLNNEINRPINGQIPLHKDKEALAAFLAENVKANLIVFDTLEEKLSYLVNQDYLESELLAKYTPDFIKQLFKQVYQVDFQFKSFMAAYKFFSQYALKTNDNEHYLETLEDRVIFNALYFANGDEALAKTLANEMIHQRYQPATPSFLNAGRKRRGELVSCFLIQVTDDMNSIGRNVNSALQLSRIGGGVGISLSNLREAGSPIKEVEEAASGVVPVMKLFEDSFSYSNQLGQRQGAGVVYLSVFHPDILAFLSTKKENADEKIRVKTLSLGVTIPDKFYELARKNEEMYLFSPYSVERVYGKPFNYIDITKEYDKLVANPNIRKTKIAARELEQEISKLQQESGYPYVINIDTANRTNPIDGTIVMSNLCSEILQVQQPSIIADNQEYLKMGTDISCNLGSTNVVNLMKSPDFAKSIDAMVRALTFVTDSSNTAAAPTINKGNQEAHTIGLGAMGLHTYLATNQIEYGSKISVEFTSIYFMLLNYWSLVSSNQLARERKQVFKGFEISEYAKGGSYFEKYLTGEFVPKTDTVKALFKDHLIPTAEDWAALKANVARYGLYHQNRLAVAPNGSISYINDTSASIHPITQKIEERQEKKIGKIYYPAPYLNNQTLPYYTSAYDMDMRCVIDVYAAATEHVDQGLSLTLFVRSEIPEELYEWKRNRKLTTRDLNILRNYAFHQGIKSIYYIRTFTEDGAEVGANQCESCVI
ncbi:MAG: class 1b ribonucleoside-diphosphate reductase subunit alpha [Streptococcaceae bacterium]|jgi:ribonucleoside-diphosphate reductase alpha chain|nr:class 1b ribonucleoside-diphosphate reductase subunit alpha [Streptococcaceae bacterium]